MFFAKTRVAEQNCHNRVNKIHLPNLMLAAAAEPGFLGIFGIEKTITLNGMGWVWTPLRLYGRHGDRAKLSQSSHGTLFCTRSASVSFWKDVHAKSKQPAIQRMQSNKQHFSREKFVYGSIKKRYSSLMMVDYQSQAFLPGKDYGLYITNIWIKLRVFKNTFIFNHLECPLSTQVAPWWKLINVCFSASMIQLNPRF